MQYFTRGPVGTKMYEGNHFIVRDSDGKLMVLRALNDADIHKGGKKGTIYAQHNKKASVYEVPWSAVVCRLHVMLTPKKIDGFMVFSS